VTRDELERLATDRYFGSVARRDLGAIEALFSEDAVMRVVTAGLAYRGRAAIVEHFVDFFGVYRRVEVGDFRVTADPATCSVAARFRIDLHGGDGVLSMTNCNFFYLRPDGLVDEVVIYTSAPVDAGFAAGAS
jgi:ketosteroid isomerase-like protein